MFLQNYVFVIFFFWWQILLPDLLWASNLEWSFFFFYEKAKYYYLWVNSIWNLQFGLSNIYPVEVETSTANRCWYMAFLPAFPFIKVVKSICSSLSQFHRTLSSINLWCSCWQCLPVPVRSKLLSLDLVLRTTHLVSTTKDYFQHLTCSQSSRHAEPSCTLLQTAYVTLCPDCVLRLYSRELFCPAWQFSSTRGYINVN